MTKGKSADAKSGTLVKGNSADHAKGPKIDDRGPTRTTDATATAASDSKGRGQLPLGEKIALNNTLKARLDALLVGSTLTYDQATTGWKNQGQLVAAMNAAQNNNLAFASIHTEMVTNGKSLPDAVAFVKAATPTSDDDGNDHDDDSDHSVTVATRATPADSDARSRPVWPSASRGGAGAGTGTTEESAGVVRYPTRARAPARVSTSQFRQFGVWLDDATTRAEGGGSVWLWLRVLARRWRIARRHSDPRRLLRSD